MQRLIRTFLGMVALSAFMVLGLGFYTQHTASRMAGHTIRTLRENYDSIRYMEKLLVELDKEDDLLNHELLGKRAPGEAYSSTALRMKLGSHQDEIESLIAAEHRNLTIPGEDALAHSLQEAANTYHACISNALASSSPMEMLSLIESHSAATADAARRIRDLNHDWMEKTARNQADSFPRFILQGTGIAFVLLIAGGYLLARRLQVQAREFQALRTHFVAMASHELRTPVTSLKMSLDLLKQETVGPLTTEQQSLVDVGMEDCDRLLVLSRQLLDVTKIQSGQLEIFKSSVELEPLIASAIKMLQSAIQEKKITVEMDLDLSPGTQIMVDPTKVTWVLTNLLGNAIRYSPVGSNVRVSGCLRRVLSFGGGSEVEIRVTDSGPGIPQEVARKVFQPYFQSSSMQKGKGQRGSAGLGLAIAHEIVASHGGRIWVDSASDSLHGATLVFTLPLAREES